MKLCPVCKTAPLTGRQKTCSPACRKELNRQQKTDEKLKFLKYTPLVQLIVTTAERAGTLSIITGVDLIALNDFVNSVKFTRWASQQQLHIAHYISVHDHGSLSPANLGLWPSWLNLRFGKQSLEGIGHRVKDRDWNNSSHIVNTREDAYTLLLKHHKKTLLKLADSGELRAPTRLDAWKQLQRKGCKLSFSTVHRLTIAEYEALLRQHKLLKPPAEVPEQQRITQITVLQRELHRQSKLAPALCDKNSMVLTESTEHDDDIITEALALAVTHHHEEALTLMKRTTPGDSNTQYKGDDGKWRNIVDQPQTQEEIDNLYRFLDAPAEQQQVMIADYWSNRPNWHYDKKTRQPVYTEPRPTYSFY